MIDRYCEQEMRQVWSEEEKLRRWLRVEWEVCREMRASGWLSAKQWALLSTAWNQMQKRQLPRLARIHAIERETRHDFIAFTTAVSEQLGEMGRFLHFGLTSSDVLDTAFALAWQEAGELIRKELILLEKALMARATETRKLLTVGRSHGMAAEPTSFGLKFLGWRQEMIRHQERLAAALEGVRFGKISGPVGNGSVWGPSAESRILKRLGLIREKVSTQIVPRDRYAHLFAVLAGVGGGLERVAIEIRHLSRSEVAEVREAFGRGQKGSSAMPHKRNPVGSENISGLSRLLRAYSQAAFENTGLWHERDMSHSSVERVIAPDACAVLHYSLRRMRGIISTLEIDRQRIALNLERAGDQIFSGPLLLALIQKNVTREVAYRWVQEVAFSAAESKASFFDHCLAHPELSRYFTPAEIRSYLDPAFALKNVERIFALARSRSS